jgi:hypothetical protein
MLSWPISAAIMEHPAQSIPTDGVSVLINHEGTKNTKAHEGRLEISKTFLVNSTPNQVDVLRTCKRTQSVCFNPKLLSRSLALDFVSLLFFVPSW